MNPVTPSPFRAEAARPWRWHAGIVALALALALLLATALASAQDDAGNQEMIDGWRATLSQTEAALSRDGLTLADLEEQRDGVQAVAAAARAFKAGIDPRIADLDAQMKAIAPPPAEGQTASPLPPATQQDLRPAQCRVPGADRVLRAGRRRRPPGRPAPRRDRRPPRRLLQRAAVGPRLERAQPGAVAGHGGRNPDRRLGNRPHRLGLARPHCREHQPRGPPPLPRRRGGGRHRHTRPLPARPLGTCLDRGAKPDAASGRC